MEFALSWLPCFLLLCAMLCRAPCNAQSCLTEPLLDQVIDIKKAVSNGVRGSDPFHAKSAEDCVTACCEEHTIAGDRDCNLLIYDTRKINTHPNCYLFNCPSPGSCPMMPSEGVNSYHLWQGISAKNTEDSDSHQPNSDDKTSTKASAKSQGTEIKESDSSVRLKDSAKKGSASVVHPESSVEKNSSSVKKVSNSAVHSQNSENKDSHTDSKSHDLENKKSTSSVQSHDSENKDSDSDLESQKTKNNEYDSESRAPDSVVKTQSSSKKDSKSDVDKQKAADKDSSSTGKGPGSVEQQDGTAAKIKGSTSRDHSEIQSNITSQMLQLAEKMEKHLEMMDPESKLDQDSSLQVIYLTPEITTKSIVTTQYEGDPTVLPTSKETKPSKANQKTSVDHIAHHSVSLTQTPEIVPSTKSHKLKAVTTAPHPLPITRATHHAPIKTSQDVKVAIPVPTKPSQDIKISKPVPSSVSKNKQNGVRSSASAMNLVPKTTPEYHKVNNLMTSTEVKHLDIKPPTTPFPPETHPVTFLKKLKSTNPASKSQAQPLTKKPVQLANATSILKTLVHPSPPNHKDPSSPIAHVEDPGETARNLDALGAQTSDVLFQPDDKNGLIAALIFGVVFLVVVIGMISRKVSEARRRHQYTKLDYLINGMYVDT
ncbi:MANSC domain-containing protein 1 [Discoglossus pictus]